MNKHIFSTFILFSASIIWGFAFVAQKVGMQSIGPFIFNGIRFLMGAFILYLFIIIFFKNKITKLSARNYYYGILLGILLFAASSMQQIGIISTTAGNAGFVTSLYIIFVPLLGLLLKHSISKIFWFSATISLVGLYLLCIKEDFVLNKGDIFVFISSIVWAVHVLCIDSFTKKNEPLILALLQFVICGVLSFITSFIFESTQISNVVNTWLPILYGGVFSVGVAFTLQVIGQKNTHPSYASLILSTESVFAVFSGWLILNEKLTFRSFVGCILILLGIMLIQLNLWYKNKLIKSN